MMHLFLVSLQEVLSESGIACMGSKCDEISFSHKEVRDLKKCGWDSS